MKPEAVYKSIRLSHQVINTGQLQTFGFQKLQYGNVRVQIKD